MKTITRRDALGGIALGGAAWVAGCAPALRPPPDNPHASTNTPPTATTSAAVTPEENTMTTPAALASKHQVVALPFKPSALNGISEKMISSHHENNYTSAVKNLNRVERELAAINKDTPPFVVAALRDRELTFRNSKTLHEAYFANLGGNGQRNGAIESALSQAYGSSGLWEQHFRATGAGLGGGSGWVVLALELDTGELRTIGSANHTQAIATAVPLLVMDMYEHSYQIDFGAAVPRYLDAFFANISWDEVNRRFERAQHAASAWRTSAS